MRVRAIDTNGDWTLGKGANDYVVDINAVSQSIRTRLQTFLGECFFATNAGMDWYNLVGGKSVAALNLAVSTMILNTENVTGLLQLSLNLTSQRLLNIQYKVQTAFSTTGLSGNFTFDIGTL